MNQINMKTHYKRILGLFLFAIISFLSFTRYTYAADPPETCDQRRRKIESKDFESRYGIDVDSHGNNLVVSLSPSKALDSIKNDIAFEVSSIVFANPGSLTLTGSQASALISGNSTLTRSKNVTINTSGYSNYGSFDVYFSPVGFTDPLITEATKKGAPCEGQSISFQISAGGEGGGSDSYNNTSCDNPITESLPDIVPEKFDLTCKDYQSKLEPSSFDYKYCENYKKAVAQGNEVSDPKAGSIFKCNSDRFVINNANADDYYTDKTDKDTKYMYHSELTHLDFGKYVYHYAAKTDDKDLVSCDVKCNEVVTVEYGPPIASKAGLCFEYKVRVTSRVRCSVETPPTPPRTYTGYCTPYPICVHSGGTIYNQGGPNNDFDDCINSCDGGKYTEKCSKKCYNKIYGKSSSTKKMSELALNYDAKVQQVADSCNYGNCKYEVHSGAISWRCGGNILSSRGAVAVDSRDSRWHKNNSWGIPPITDYTTYKAAGIPARPGCKDKCSWNGCNGGVGVYLNPNVGNKDYDDNVKKYKKAIEQCNANVTCSSKIGEFSIEVDYYAGKARTKRKVVFPYTGSDDSKDRIGICEGNASDTSVNANTTILKKDGCYANCEAHRWYQTEWSFPGTWLQNKTGEISYEPQNGRAWTPYERKFCSPLNAQNVNTKWYNAYYAKLYKDDPQFSYNDDDYLRNIAKCPNGASPSSIKCNYESYSYNSETDDKDIDWNIRAITKDFGYFAWKIQIDCFYAMNKDFPGDGEGKCVPECRDGGDVGTAMRVRAVDLTNLFPDASGSALTSPNTTGRSPGFNWSAYGGQTTKDPTYPSLPNKYTTWVQSKGYNVYSDEYVDYEVFLNKDTIAKLRDTEHNVTDYEGQVDLNGSVVNYQSPLFRGGALSGGKNIYPDANTLKCNNIGSSSGSRSAGYSASCWTESDS